MKFLTSRDSFKTNRSFTINFNLISKTKREKSTIYSDKSKSVKRKSSKTMTLSPISKNNSTKERSESDLHSPQLISDQPLLSLATLASTDNTRLTICQWEIHHHLVSNLHRQAKSTINRPAKKYLKRRSKLKGMFLLMRIPIEKDQNLPFPITD